MARRFSGTELRRLRVAAGVSVEQLAIHINRTAYAVHQYETGRSAPQAASLAAIADLLDISIDDLFATTEAVAA